MSEMIFMEIANEIKGLHNSAAELIKSTEYEKALAQYKKALAITQKISYYEGAGMTLYNMANLKLLTNNPIESLKYATKAKDMFSKVNLPLENMNEFISKLSLSIKKQGIDFEKKGRFEEAVEYYEAAIPFSEGKDKQAMTHEVNLLRRILNDRK